MSKCESVFNEHANLVLTDKAELFPIFRYSWKTGEKSGEREARFMDRSAFESCLRLWNANLHGWEYREIRPESKLPGNMTEEQAWSIVYRSADACVRLIKMHVDIARQQVGKGEQGVRAFQWLLEMSDRLP